MSQAQKVVGIVSSIYAGFSILMGINEGRSHYQMMRAEAEYYRRHGCLYRDSKMGDWFIAAYYGFAHMLLWPLGSYNGLTRPNPPRVISEDEYFSILMDSDRC